MSFFGTLGRIGLGAATGGTSELVRGGLALGKMGLKTASGGDGKAGLGQSASASKTGGQRFGAMGRARSAVAQMQQRQAVDNQIAQEQAQLAASQAQFQQQQGDLRARYEGVLNGTAPSAAQAQLQMGVAQAGRNANLIAGQGNTPMARALAMRQAQRSNAEMAGQAGGQAAVLRAQEMDAARAALGQVNQATSAADLAYAQGGYAGAGLQNDVYGQRAGIGLQGQALELQRQKQVDDYNVNARSLGLTRRNQDFQLAGSLANGVAPMIGALSKLSDKTAKKDIKKGDEDVSDFLKSIKAYRYKYKDEKFGKGDQVSVMAQDLEKSAIGKKAIVEDFGGTGKKGVNYAELMPAMLASLAHLNERVSARG